MLEILSADGEVLNSFAPGSGDDKITTKSGLNRFVWDWRVKDFAKRSDFATYRGPLAYRVQPGNYSVRLTVGESNVVQDFDVLGDPRRDVTPADVQQKQDLLEAIYAEAIAVVQTVQSLQSIRTRVGNLLDMMDDEASQEIASLRDALIGGIDGWLNDVIEEDNEHFVNAQHSSTRMDFSLLEIMMMVDMMESPLTQGILARSGDVRNRWSALQNDYQGILDGELAAFNSVIAEKSIPAISASEGKSP